MNSKFLKRNNLPNNNKDIEEIIEIEDNPSSKPVRVKISQKKRKKEFGVENCSSEATTPNKKKQIKKKNDDDLIEIMDEISDPGKKKVSFPALRQKKSKSILPSKKNKKTEKESIQSIPELKLKGKSKSPIFKNKRKSKISSINLYGNNIDEESDIQMTIDEKLDSNKTQKYGENKVTPYKNNFVAQNKKFKKNEKINNKNNNVSNQIELLSEDSGNEEYMQMLPQKRKKDNKSIGPTNKTNYGWLSSNKLSKKENVSPNKNDNKKSKSIIKMNSKQDQLNHMRNLLGKKRKPEKKISESITPRKKNGKSNTPIKNNINIPSQIIANKLKSRTPIKIINNKNSINEDLLEPKIGAKDKSPKIDINSNTLEIAVLSKLVDKFGLENVLDSLCQPKLNKNSELDSCLQGLKDSCDENRITLIMCKMIFKFFYSKIKEQKDSNNEKEKEKVKSPPIISEIPDIKTFSNNNMNEKEKLKYEVDKSPSKSNLKFNSSVLSVMDQCIGGSSIQNEDKEPQIKNEIKTSVNNKNIKVKEIKKEEGGKQGKKIMSIGSHYNKEETGKIYKYQVSSLDGKGNAIFKCYDERCNGMGIYELETKKFVKTNMHKLNHGEHEYIINNEKDTDEVFKQLIEKDKSDAQVFKENGERIVKYY